MIFEKGAKEAIERILAAYGFSTRQQLCNQLGISKSTLANRVFRDNFPADYIVQCALETGASLLWLSTGRGEIFPDGEQKSTDVSDISIPTIKKMTLRDGILETSGKAVIDKSLCSTDIKTSTLIENGITSFVITETADDIKNGLWLVSIDGIYGMKKVFRIPGGKIRVSDDDVSFDCAIDDVKLIGRVLLTLIKSE